MSSTAGTNQLKIQQGIRQAEDDLVSLIEKALDNKSSYGKLEESQFRNLLRVAEVTESPEVIKNFLRYQVGRDEKWGQGKNSLAEQIITDIQEELKPKAEEIAKDSGGGDYKPILIALTRLYLGYGSRYLKYLNSLPKEDKQQNNHNNQNKGSQPNSQKNPTNQNKGSQPNSQKNPTNQNKGNQPNPQKKSSK
jgi:hypothetical protein